MCVCIAVFIGGLVSIESYENKAQWVRFIFHLIMSVIRQGNKYIHSSYIELYYPKRGIRVLNSEHHLQ